MAAKLVSKKKINDLLMKIIRSENLSEQTSIYNEIETLLDHEESEYSWEDFADRRETAEGAMLLVAQEAQGVTALEEFEGHKEVKVEYILPEELKIIKDPSDPLFDPRALHEPTDEFINDILINGVEENVQYTKRGGENVLINGRTRTLAARAANALLEAQGSKHRVKVPCIRKTNVSDEKFIERAIKLNTTVKQETVSTLGHKMASQIAILTKNKKMSKAEAWLKVAQDAGCDIQTARKKVKLATKVIPELLVFLDRKQVTQSQALKWCKLSEEKQKEKAKELKAKFKGKSRKKRSYQRKGWTRPSKKLRETILDPSAIYEAFGGTEEEGPEWDEDDISVLLKWIVGEMSTDDAKEKCSAIAEFESIHNAREQLASEGNDDEETEETEETEGDEEE